MELIPILSTIILVATISTFILAIGAYILYKIREGKQGRTSYTQKEKIEAEVVKPKEKVFVEDVLKPEVKKTIVTERYQPVYVPADQTELRTDYNQEEVKKSLKIEMPETRFAKVTGTEHLVKKDEGAAEEIRWR